MKRWTKQFCGLCVAPLLLFIVAVALFYVPAVQRLAVNKAVAEVEKLLEMEVHINKVRLAFPLHLSIQGLQVGPSDQQVGQLDRLLVDVDIRQLLNGKLVVNAVEIDDLCLHTDTLLDALCINGHIDRLRLKADDIDLVHGVINGIEANLWGGAVDLCLQDTTAADTTTSEMPNLLLHIRHAGIEQVALRIAMPTDTLQLDGQLQQAEFRNATLSLAEGCYWAESLSVNTDTLALLSAADSLMLVQSGLKLDSVQFCQADFSGKANVMFNGQMHNGIRVDQLSAQVAIDSIHYAVDSLALSMPHSALALSAYFERAAKAQGRPGCVWLKSEGHIGKADIIPLLAPILPTETLCQWPEEPLQLTADIAGTSDTLAIENISLHLPTVAQAKLKGILWGRKRIADSDASLQLDLSTTNLSLLQPLIKAEHLTLPPMQLVAKFDKHGTKFVGDIDLVEREGKVQLDCQLDASCFAYQASGIIDNMQLNHFLPVDSLSPLSAQVNLMGMGIGVFNPKTHSSLQAHLEAYTYKNTTLGNISIDARLDSCLASLHLTGSNDLFHLNSLARLWLDQEESHGTVNIDLDGLDLYALGIARDTLAANMELFLSGQTNFRNKHNIDGGLRGIQLVVPDTTYRLLDLDFGAILRPDSFCLKASAGDLRICAQSQYDLNHILTDINAFTRELNRERADYILDQDTLRPYLPHIDFQLESGKHNPLRNFLVYATGLSFNKAFINLSAHPETGLNGAGYLYGLHTGAIPLDTIDWHIQHDSLGIHLDAHAGNSRKNKTIVFDSYLSAMLHNTGFDANLKYVDDKGRTGINLGFLGEEIPGGIQFRVKQNDPIIAYRNFSINADNFFSVTGRKIGALVDLNADDGTRLKIYSTPAEDTMHDITAEMTQINLGNLSAIVPYMPRVEGIFDGDLHYVLQDTTVSISADAYVAGLKLENNSVGDVGLSAVYLPLQKGGSYVDALLTYNDRQVGHLSGSYDTRPKGNGINLLAELSHLPLQLANGFVPDHVAALDGFASGHVHMGGKPGKGVVNGELYTESMKLMSTPYSLNLTIPNDTIFLRNNVIDFNRIQAYTTGKNPLTLDGTIRLDDPAGLRFNVGIVAKNYPLINARKTREAIAYGKAFVDVGAFVQGTPANLKMRGRLTVLGNSDFTYVLTDSPLSDNDQLSELVEFVDMADTIYEKQVVDVATPTKMDMLFNVAIEQGAQVHCLLNPTGRDYVNLEGGGDLTLSYNAQRQLNLMGRYTIISGDMKYSLMGLVSKKFDIKPNSYVEFHGDAANPTLHISAVQHTKSTVTENNVPRSVNFDVGLTLSRRLKDMGLEFTLEAPEDLAIQNELDAMGAAQRGRVAVTMLASGIYLTDNYQSAGTGTTDALFNYLQTQAGNLAGKALKSIDVNFGINNTRNAMGMAQTDYNFSFSKRFWNNRFRFVIGGKVSSGSHVVNNTQSILDKVSLEYRLDNTGTRYVKLYYDKNSRSLLEGELVEIGGGAIFRRKSEKLSDLFTFRRKNKTTR